jgi:hypothetical protein
VATSDYSDSSSELESNVDSEHVHVVLTALELDIVVDALRSVGNLELAEHLELILRRLGQR